MPCPAARPRADAMQGTLAPKLPSHNTTTPQVTAPSRKAMLTNSRTLWRNSFTGQGGAPHRSRCRERLRRSPSPSPAGAAPRCVPQPQPLTTGRRIARLHPEEQPYALAAPSPTLHPTEPLQALAASLRTPQPRRLPTASAITAARPPPQRPPCTPSQIREPICCQRPHGLISESSGCGWTDNQGPTASHQVATWAVDGIHAVEDCARSNRGAPGCKSRELSTTVLR